MSKVLKLNNGFTIPTVGLGTYLVSSHHCTLLEEAGLFNIIQARSHQAVEAVKAAVDAGYRHFDTAWYYGNEKEVGEGLRAKIADGAVKREDLFITTKIWNNYHEKNLVVPKLKESLKAFQLDYVDLFLVHWPMGWKKNADPWPTGDKTAYSDVDYIETWEGMEECVTLGLTKSIGVSNFNSEQITRLVKNCKIKPVVNQVEANVKINQKKLIQFCKNKEIVITGYCPLVRGREVLDNPKLIEIGKKYNKKSSQVILNYLVSLGIAVIPKSSSKSHIISNIDIFNFTLDSADLEYLDTLNDNSRIVAISFFSDHKYFPFGTEF